MNIAKSRRIPNAIWLLGQDVTGKEYPHFWADAGKGKMMTVEVASRQGVASCKMKNKKMTRTFARWQALGYEVKSKTRCSPGVATSRLFGGFRHLPLLAKARLFFLLLVVRSALPHSVLKLLTGFIMAVLID
jgi:hypothetical protein